MLNTELVLSCEEARELDRLTINEIGVPGIVLMENAGRGVVDYFLSLKTIGPIIICCGKGNNAGDGFVIARHLDNLGFFTKILLFSDPDELKGDAKINYNIAFKSLLSITIVNHHQLNFICQEIISSSGWIIDALFGTGLTGEIGPPYNQVIAAINNSCAQVLSVDVPSGLNCDTGEPLGMSVKADHTATFVGYKKGFMQKKAKEYLGKVKVIDIGIPRILIRNHETNPRVG